MALMDFIKKQFIDIIEWVKPADGSAPAAACVDVRLIGPPRGRPPQPDHASDYPQFHPFGAAGRRACDNRGMAKVIATRLSEDGLRYGAKPPGSPFLGEIGRAHV